MLADAKSNHGADQKDLTQPKELLALAVSISQRTTSG